jgi:hypothetical protein
MTRRTVRSAALGCAALLLVSGCHTGADRAESRRELIKPGMTADEVRDLLGEPDAVSAGRSSEESEPVVEWSYTYTTPWTMFLLPTIGLFTLLFTVPSFECIFGLSMGLGWLRVEFGSEWRVLRAGTVMNY